MNWNDQIKRAKRAVARWGLFSVSALIVKLPYKIVEAMTYGFVAIGYVFAVKQKNISYESLQIAFGSQKSKKEIDHIAHDCFFNIGKGMIELMYFMAHPSFIRDRVYFENKHYLDEAFAQGKGVIAISAHFGNFPLMLLRCAQEGYKTNAIIRPTRDEKIEKYFLNQRSKLGLNTVYAVPRKACVDQSLRVLRNNEMLFIPLDQNFGSGAGVFVDFFGQKAATATGPVVFAMRTKAPLLPMFVVRDENDRHRIIIDKPLQLEIKDTDEETILVNTARITQVIERYIRKYPQEWGWMHRRWKSRPPGEPAGKLNDQAVV